MIKIGTGVDSDYDVKPLKTHNLIMWDYASWQASLPESKQNSWVGLSIGHMNWDWAK